VPQAHLDSFQYCTADNTANCINSTAGAGLAADLVIYVTAKHVGACGSNSAAGSKAFAAECRSDANDRPIFGSINFCPQMVLDCTSNPTCHQQQLNTAIHEMIHVLGFSGAKYAYWRDPSNGQPRTTRDAQGEPNLGTMSLDGGASTVFRPAATTMAVASNVRGTGNTVHTIVTPSVKNAVNSVFGCAAGSIPGGELEQQGGGGTAGSHWEMRIYLNELMAGTEHPVMVRSVVTLALLKDTGWYDYDPCVADKVNHV